MSLLFVTSFTGPMFQATGARLVRSFLRTGTEGTLLACTEKMPDKRALRDQRLLTFALDESATLAAWEAANRKIIPTEFGGTAGPCGCEGGRNYFGIHRPRCHNAWFNRNAARWFRKVVALEYAMGLGYDPVVWVDSDCVFKAGVSTAHVRHWFQGRTIFYLKSPERRVIESGLLGVRNSPDGRQFVSETLARYSSGKFRRNARWDDAYQFQLAMRRLPAVTSVDMATGATGPRPYGHVLPHSPAGRFLFHQKGIHGRSGIIG